MDAALFAASSSLRCAWRVLWLSPLAAACAKAIRAWSTFCAALRVASPGAGVSVAVGGPGVGVMVGDVTIVGVVATDGVVCTNGVRTARALVVVLVATARRGALTTRFVVVDSSGEDELQPTSIPIRAIAPIHKISLHITRFVSDDSLIDPDPKFHAARPSAPTRAGTVPEEGLGSSAAGLVDKERLSTQSEPALVQSTGLRYNLRDRVDLSAEREQVGLPKP